MTEVLTRVTWSFADGIGEIVLSSPERANAIDLDTARQVREAAAAVTAHDGVDLRILLLRAEGRHFSVGGDLRAFEAQGARVDDYLREVTTELHAGLELIWSISVPVIVAVHGAVAGAGVGLALVGDLAVFAEDVSLSLAYAAVGLAPDNGSSYLLPRMLGERRALELILTNQTIAADQALTWGLATRVVPRAQLEGAVHELVDSLLAGSTASQIAAKQLVRSSWGRSLHDQSAAESAAISSLSTSPFSRAAIHRFLQR